MFSLSRIFIWETVPINHPGIFHLRNCAKWNWLEQQHNNTNLVTNVHLKNVLVFFFHTTVWKRTWFDNVDAAKKKKFPLSRIRLFGKPSPQESASYFFFFFFSFRNCAERTWLDISWTQKKNVLTLLHMRHRRRTRWGRSALLAEAQWRNAKVAFIRLPGVSFAWIAVIGT